MSFNRRVAKETGRPSGPKGGIDRDNDEKMTFDASEGVKVMTTFDSLNLKEDLLRGIYAYSKERG